LQRAVLWLSQQHACYRPALHPSCDGKCVDRADKLRGLFSSRTPYHASGRHRIDYLGDGAPEPAGWAAEELAKRGAVPTISTGSRLVRTIFGPSKTSSARAPRCVSTRWYWSNTRFPSE